MTYETQIEKLKAKESPYVLGSAIALSCFILAKDADEIADRFLRLSEVDALLYQAQCGKAEFSKEEWERLLRQYQESLDDLRFLLMHRLTKGLAEFFNRCLVMLTTLFQESVSYFERSFSESYLPKEMPILMNKRRYFFEWNEESKKKASYPLLSVLNKLVYRKNQGKKPFVFDSESTFVLDELDCVVDKRKEWNPSMIKEIALFSSSCVSQIKMLSLQTDFRFLSEVLMILSEQD